MEMKQVGVQLYTVREHLRTRADIAATLRKLRKIGYAAVQPSGLEPISEEELAKILREEGLICCATHEDSEQILSNPEALAEKLRRLGCCYTAYPYPSGVRLETLADVKSLAARLNAAGQVLHRAGITLTYHNHSIEFRRFNGRLMLEVLFEESDPRYLQAEIDTYWVQHGGGDPEEWCRRLTGRLPLLHLKDYSISADNKPAFAEIGAGNLNWKAIIAAAQQSGCEWYIVEQDVCPGDPFESLRISLEYIRKNLVGDVGQKQ